MNTKTFTQPKFLLRFALVFIMMLAFGQIWGQTTVVSNTFESDSEGWTLTGFNRTNNSYSGSSGYYLRLTNFNNYNNNTTASATSGTLNLSTKYNLVLEVLLRYRTELGFDGMNFEYSADNGATWQILGSMGEGINWYNSGDVDALADMTHGWSGNNNAWQTARIALPSTLENNSTVRIRANFKSDASNTNDGVAFDNFTILSYPTAPLGATYYPYGSSVNWNNINNWTTDPTGGTRVNPKIPDAGDFVVINNGYKVTIPDGINNLTVDKITVNGSGTLDLTSTTGHNFLKISGNGIIKMMGNSGNDNFPAGNCSDFVDETIGGTLEVYGTGINLNQPRTLRNLKINLSSGSAILTADYTINGSLNIKNGDFKINNTTNTTPINLSVKENILVESTATLSVGTANAIDAKASSVGNYHKYYHVITVNGNFTNQGTVRLTNQDSPNYTTRTNTGAASLYFTGATNKSFNCEGVTDLYYLVINKGADQTNILTINATAKNHFALFGDNDEDTQDDYFTEPNPENRKALWIKTGTLSLEGYVTIPTLTEGARDFFIGENAALELNGSNVFVSSTAVSTLTGVHPEISYAGLSYSASTGINNGQDVQAFYVNGTLRINDGTLQTSNSYGIVYRAESPANRFEINGGTATISQFHISTNATPANAKMTYMQTGGVLNIVNFKRATSPIFDLSAGLGSFIMSGGTMYIKDISDATVNCIYIACALGNISVTGGTIILNNTSANNRTATISTTAPLHNFILRANRGNGVQLSSALDVNNDFTIEAETFNANGNNVSIGSDFFITGGTYTTGNNTTIFDGDKRSTVYFPTGTTQVLNNLTIAKTIDDKDFSIGTGNATTAIRVDGTFRVESGGFDYATYNVSLKGNAYIADTVGTAASTTGKIVFDGTVRQNLTSVNGVIGNMQINNTFTSSHVSLTGDLNIYKTLTLTSGVFDINTYRLIMFGSQASISGTFGTTRMIQTDGNASDGGLGLYIASNTSPDTKIVTFPIGTDDNATTRYTPLVATYSSTFDDGYVYLSVADNELPTTGTGTGGSTLLSYYWHVEYSDFTTLPIISSYVFTASTTDAPGGTFNANWQPGKVLNVSPFQRNTEKKTNVSSPTITFNGDSQDSNYPTPFYLESCDYSLGSPSKFNGNPDIYFTRYTSGTYDWNTGANWDKGSVGSPQHQIPDAGSIVVIREGARMNVSGAINTLGAVNFTQSLPTPTTEQLGRIQFLANGTYNLGVIAGTGMISFDASKTISTTGDFGDFGSKEYSYYLYFGGNATLSAIPTPIPNLMLESYTYNINQAITTNGNLIIQGNGTIIPQQNMTIGKNLFLGFWYGGTFQFPSQAAAVTVNVGGNIDFTQFYLFNGDRNLTVVHNTQNVEHRLILNGTINQGADAGYDIDLWNTNARERVILELQGEGNDSCYSSSAAIPQLYRIIMNKGANQASTFTFKNRFTLNGTTDGLTAKALELQNGNLILNAASLDINLTTANRFTIPATSGLTVSQGTVRANGTDGGIVLNGLLRINGGTVNMTGTATSKNFIEYGASGTASIEISSGNLIVGTQIRRLTTSTAGVLKYSQTGGDVLIGVNNGDAAYETDLGIFEVLNSGSQFIYTGGTLTLQRQNGASPSVAALTINPSSYQVENSTITLGNSNMPSAQNNFGINVNIALGNLTLYSPDLADDPNYLITNQELTINGDLLIHPTVTFDGNGFNLTLKGDIINNGIYIANGNTLSFSSTESQTISGTGTEDIYKLTKEGSSTLMLNKNITINNTFTHNEGSINSSVYSFITKGNVMLNATIISTSGNGLSFEGTSQQLLERGNNGTSIIDIMTINNPYGVKVTNNGHWYFINKELRFINGVFDIGGSLLEIGANAILTPVNTYSLTNMIQTNSSFQDKGVRKYLNSGITTDFFFPVGQLKYTPLTIDLSGTDFTSGTTNGYISVKPSNEFHPTSDDPSNNYSTGDKNNVLQCYWSVGANSLSGFHGDLIFGYADADVKIDQSGVPGFETLGEDDYISARILLNNNPTYAINKYSIDEVDQTLNTIIYHINGSDENGVAGDYFAGLDLAIPENVASYTTSLSGGNVDKSSSYTSPLPTDDVAPSGAVLEVASGANLVFNVNDVKVYKTIINANATLTINSTDGHRLGIVTGTGTLKIVSNINSIAFPAGDYETFFDCAGGGVEFAGIGSYTVMAGKPQIRNLLISDSGTKELANDIEICNNFTLNGPIFDIPDNLDFKVNNNVLVSGGTFNSGTNNFVTVLGSVSLTGATSVYNGQTSGTDVFGSLSLSNGTFNVGSGGTVSILGNLTYTGGAFNGGSGTSSVVLKGSSAQTITGMFTGGSQFHNLVINNPSGIVLAGNVTINNSLLLSNGLITTGSNTLLLNSAATITPSTGSSTKYINGKLSKIIASAGDGFVFPVGKSGRWGYAGVQNVTAGGLIWDVEYFVAKATNETLVDNFTPTNSSIKTVTESEYWKITDNGVSQANVTISWNSLSNVSIIPAEREKLEVMVWNDGASSWDNKGGGSFSSGHTQATGSFTSSSLLQFSENIITLGTSEISNPLPVELLSFTGSAQADNVVLYWSTASELNNDYFEVQRSIDAVNFITIGKVYGAGNSMVQLDYAYVDRNPNNGTSYYRLKQVDYDGAFEIHNTIAVNWDGPVSDFDSDAINIYPNPYRTGDLILDLYNLEPYTSINISITDIRGKQIFNASLLVPEDKKVNIVPIAVDRLNKGIYVVSVQTTKNVMNKKVIVN